MDVLPSALPSVAKCAAKCCSMVVRWSLVFWSLCLVVDFVLLFTFSFFLFFCCSTDNAAKAFGADLRHSIAYIKCYLPGLVIPMMCMVDYRGFRVQCTAVVPLKIPKVDEMGEVRSGTLFLDC